MKSSLTLLLERTIGVTEAKGSMLFCFILMVMGICKLAKTKPRNIVWLQVYLNEYMPRVWRQGSCREERFCGFMFI